MVDDVKRPRASSTLWWFWLGVAAIIAGVLLPVFAITSAVEDLLAVALVVVGIYMLWAHRVGRRSTRL